MTSPIVFISYHHRDELFKERLLSHLSVLEHSGLLNAWSDDKIAAGANWTAEITQVISRAQVAILLISSNFLSSDFTLQREVPTLLERRLKEGIRIYPIILKPCAWQRVEWLARIQVRPKGGKPLTSFDEDEIDEILADIALEIATLVQFSQAYRGLSEVEFGHIAAEEETRQLQKYFIETAEYSSVISEQGKLLVTGRKGSGKSAIYVTLRDHLPEQDLTAIVEALTLEDYPWEVHKMVMDKGVSIEQAYVNSWKYIIWVILAKKELGYSQIERYRFIDPLFWKLGFNANRRYLIRFLKQNYGSVAPSLTELLADRARQVRSLTIKDFGIGTEKDNDPFQRLSQSINIVNREIEARVLEILSDNKYYLLFDQLDLGWDNTEESKHLITGLILAARDVTRAARKKNKRVQVTIFLRSDIYESLRFEDKNKLSPDEVALKWDGDRLKELVARRIEVSANGTLSDVFDDGDVTAGKSILDYMAERTMLRPRDMIQFCVFAREMAIQLGMFKINNESIQKAKFLYSDYMRKEIQDESKALEHDIGMLFEILREVGSDTVNKKTFLRKCRLRDISNEETALQQLIDLSVLGLHRATVRDDHSQEVLYRYSTSLWDHLEPLADTYFVHPSLKPELRLEK